MAELLLFIGVLAAFGLAFWLTTRRWWADAARFGSRSQPPPTLNPTSNQHTIQVTSISQFSDVRPTDWAYQALSNLIERYGCVAGYPDGTYKGQRGP
jgi:hypothetical protein